MQITEGTNEPKEAQEHIETGKLAASVYIEYWKAGANSCLLVVLALLFIIAQLACNSCDIWIRNW